MTWQTGITTNRYGLPETYTADLRSAEREIERLRQQIKRTRRRELISQWALSAVLGWVIGGFVL